MSKDNNIKHFDIESLREVAVTLGEAAYRGNQMAEWLYLRGVGSFEQMANLPAKFRAKLAENYSLAFPEVVQTQEAEDGTRKYLLRLTDGLTVETVAIPSANRLTVCFSTQVGCAMACAFCATGRDGLARSLDTGEIIDQLLVVSQDFKQRKQESRITNVVAMGQGEPFANYDATVAALKLINNQEFLGIGARHITVSTCGLVRQIRRFANEVEQFTLAVSLHSAVQETRNKLMPGLVGQPLDSLQRALLDYMAKTSRRPSLEYAMIDGVNDTAEQLAALVDFCRVPAPGLHVNLIKLNPLGDVLAGSKGRQEYKASELARFKEFEAALKLANVGVSIRASKGAQIAAACGQLSPLNK